jgi:putative membrane protein
MARRALTPEDHARIAAAIRAAEAKTSGEIYCVVARASDSYFVAAALAVTAGILIASLVAALVLDRSWEPVAISHFVAAQILAAIAALVVLRAVPALRLHLVPLRHRYRRAHDNALKQFLARNVHITSARTGVLIFVSLAERYAEVVADSGINARTPQETWNAIVADLVEAARGDRLADGFVAAIGTVGHILAEHFPVSADDENELGDHVIEI